MHPGNHLIPENQWTHITIGLESLPEVAYVFDAQFRGAGRMEIRNVRFDSETVLAVPSMKEEEIAVYSNPANQFVTIAMQSYNTENIHVALMNSLGQSVLQKKYQPTGAAFKEDINVNSLSQGAYNQQILSGDKVFYKRILTQ